MKTLQSTPHRTLIRLRLTKLAGLRPLFQAAAESARLQAGALQPEAAAESAPLQAAALPAQE